MLINEIVATKLPFIDLNNASLLEKVNNTKWEVLYLLQSYLGKAADEVENENTYTAQQKILVGTYIAYNLLINKAIEVTGGNATTQSAATNRVLTKAKADAVESEFTVLKASDGANIALTGEKLLATLKTELCNTAKMLQIQLPICDCGEPSVQPFFKVIR